MLLLIRVNALDSSALYVVTNTEVNKTTGLCEDSVRAVDDLPYAILPLNSSTNYPLSV